MDASAIKKAVTPLRLSSLVIVLLLIWGAYPFINGMGCDFPFEIDDDAHHIIGNCHGGTLKYVTFFKKTGTIAIRKDLYGVIGRKVIAIRLDRIRYASPPPGFSDIKEVLSEYNYTSDGIRVYFWGRSKNNNKEYFFLQKSQFSKEGNPSILFKVSTHGRIAYFEPS